MALDVATPEPPDLTNRPLPGGVDPDTVDAADLRREELETALRDGAWETGFAEWAEYTDLDEAAYRRLLDAGLVHGLDLYWDPEAGGVAFELPPIPDAVADDEAFSTPAASELADLGETVADVLDADYADWDDAGNWESTDTDLGE